MIREFIYDRAAVIPSVGVCSAERLRSRKKAMGPSHAHSLEQGIFALLDRRMGKRRFPAPQTEDTLDCALLEGELASERLAALRERDLPELAAEVAPDWGLSTEAVQSVRKNEDAQAAFDPHSSCGRVKHLLAAPPTAGAGFTGLLRRIFMGYDVSFHPISPEEMREWYFGPLTWVQQGREEKVLALAAQYGMEDFYAEKYLDTLRVGAGTGPDELFDKSHGFYIAVIQGFFRIEILHPILCRKGQHLFLPALLYPCKRPKIPGFFRDYFYTRGSAFSFLVEQKPEYVRYFTPWEQIVPAVFPNPAENRIIENYCSGVYLSPDQAAQLLQDLEQDKKVQEDLEGLWCDGQLAVLKKALTAAVELGTGLLEATEVVEPDPISPNESTSYSNLYHCDRDGVYLYIDMAMKQIAQAMGKDADDR